MTSVLHQPFIGLAPALHQHSTSPTSALHLPSTSPAPAQHQPGPSPAPAVQCVCQATYHLMSSAPIKARAGLVSTDRKQLQMRYTSYTVAGKGSTQGRALADGKPQLILGSLPEREINLTARVHVHAGSQFSFKYITVYSTKMVTFRWSYGNISVIVS